MLIDSGGERKERLLLLLQKPAVGENARSATHFGLHFGDRSIDVRRERGGFDKNASVGRQVDGHDAGRVNAEGGAQRAEIGLEVG